MVMEANFYQVHLGDFFVAPGMLNHLNILHGGVLLKHCDSTVGVLANRYSHSRVLTVAINQFEFKRPAHVEDHIWFRITLLKTGRHSMNFLAEVFSQGITQGDPVKIGEGIMVFVAVNQALRPVKIPPYQVTDTDHQTKINAIIDKFGV
ncbi:hotdog domain-containing protein [Lactiplantibacillus plajomi]